MTDVQLLYFDGCPNWQQCHEVLLHALRRLGLAETTVTLQSITSVESADTLAFRGSPTVLVNGNDPFADGNAPVGLTCRVFQTPNGLAGTPTLEQLLVALTT